MRRHLLGNLALLILIVTMVPLSGLAQNDDLGPVRTEAEIHKLMADSTSRDLKVSEAARTAIDELDSRHIPVLKKMAAAADICDRTGALRILVADLDKNNSEYVPAVAEIAKGGSSLSAEKELFCRRGAAYLLSYSGEGIREMTKILKGGNMFAKRSVAFALDDLTESSDYSNGRLEAMKEAIPAIAKASDSSDRTLSGVSWEVLSQLADYGPAELKVLAKKYVKD